MFGSFMMFASGWVASSPSSARASGTTWSAFRFSGKCDRILPAKEMSFNSYSIPELAVKARTIGRSEWVARAGASSVWVYAIFEVDIEPMIVPIRSNNCNLLSQDAIC